MPGPTAAAKGAKKKTARDRAGEGRRSGTGDRAADGPRRLRRPVSPAAAKVLEHVKVLFAFLVWISLVRQQASAIVNWQLYYAHALVATGALAVGSVVVVYTYPPRTPRWRTIVWTFFASSAGGALVYAALGGRAGLLGALLSGALLLWARGEEHGRRAVRRLRQRRS
ncbi:hypothetical protein [Streptomyces sp. TP-A0356]|uniref:hypothetical protein n=1 Tax=Streptomyces sp. TP-A0356 TaxID=1359208 RepID=UPI000A4E063D|nr:hypothetical protein [Streptomyces sp. TP-A0356]